MKINIEKIQELSNAILKNLNIPEDHVQIITDTILYAHMRGKETHGIRRLPVYVRKIENGLMTPNTAIIPCMECDAISVIDANNGFGQVAAYHAMQTAIQKSEKYGIAVSFVKHSNNFGAAGYFTQLAARNWKAGIVMANAAPAISVGGPDAMLGTNPISIGLPMLDDKNPFILDIAMSNAARSKVRLALQNNETIPEGWALDKNGFPTTDPREALSGVMLPIGGHKGMGLAMAVDLLAGMLSGASFGGNVHNLDNLTDVSDSGCILISIDPLKLMNKHEYKNRATQFINNVHAYGGIMPGEHGLVKNDKTYEYELSDKLSEELKLIIKQRGIEIDL